MYYLVSFKVPDGDESARLYMNKDLGFDESQYALLASFGFTALFTVFSLIGLHPMTRPRPTGWRKQAVGDEGRRTDCCPWFQAAVGVGGGLFGHFREIWAHFVKYSLFGARFVKYVASKMPRRIQSVSFVGSVPLSLLLAPYHPPPVPAPPPSAAGRLADRVNRAQVAGLGALAWSLCGLGIAGSTSFASVLDLRALTGVSEAFLNPQVTASLSPPHLPPHPARRPSSLSVSSCPGVAARFEVDRV